MGVKFLGTPIEQFDQLCKKEEIVKITIECFKREPLYSHNTDVDGSATMEIEELQTAGWSQQIKSSKDIFSFDGDATLAAVTTLST